MKECEEQEDDEMYAPPSKRVRGEASLPILPKLEEKKPMVGPTGEEGKIKVLWKAEIDGYLTSPEDMTKMAEMGLPSGFVFGSLNTRDSRLQQKKQKKTFFCDLCSIELNSEDTMQSHMKGSRHMKKQIAQQQQNKGEILSIRPIENPAVMRKKQPIRLQQKIWDSPHPIVGLSHIKEFIACSNSEMEPHYECDLCGTQGQANCMFQHLIGAKHRQAAVDKFYNDDPARMDLSQKELLQFAEEHNENDDRVSERIQSRYSDDEYPWPHGMEPWLLENGGSGIIPDGARANFGKTQPKPNQTRRLNSESEEPKPKTFPSSSITGIIPIHSDSRTSIPLIDDIPMPRSKDEVMRMIETSSKLLLRGMELNNAKPEERHLMSSTLNVIKYAVMSRPVRGASSRRSPSSSSRSISSVDTSRERSSSMDYESKRRRREERRDGSGSQAEAWVKREPRREDYDHERRRGSYKDDYHYRRDGRRHDDYYR